MTNNILLSGLESSVFKSAQESFQREHNFGKKLYIAAWLVEILAASLGLLIAFFIAYDAYIKSNNQTGPGVLNAITGALPFVLIAVIELTKIPLASGLYKVRHRGWRALIFFTLIALIAVTFETMFVGLERQMTNITAIVTQDKARIQQFENEIKAISDEIEQRSRINVANEVQQLDNQIRQLEQERDAQLKTLEEEYRFNQSRNDDIRQRLETSRSDLENTILELLTTQINSAQARATRSEAELERIRENITRLESRLESDNQLTELREQVSETIGLINQTENWINSNEAAQIQRAQARIGVQQDGRIGQNTRRNFEGWREQQREQISALETQISQRRSDLNIQLQNLRQQEQNIELSIEATERRIEATELEISDRRITLRENPPTDELAQLAERLTEIEKTTLNAEQNYTQQRIQMIESSEFLIATRSEERNRTEDDFNRRIAEIPELRDRINQKTDNIGEIENRMRSEMRDNQVYRFAQKVRGYEDILSVDEKDTTLIGAIWFGSIAFICATVGTVLALTANIMMDPKAFSEKQKMQRNKPVGRALRRMMLIVRKKILKRRPVVEKEKIVYVDKPVEVIKEVEKIVEVEKIIEVERIVEKEIEKFVPEIIPVPIFVSANADVDAELSKAEKQYSELKKKMDLKLGLQ